MIDFNQLCREPSKVAATLQFELVPSIQARIAAVLLALSARLEWDLTYKRAQSYGPEEIDFNALMRGPMALRTLPPRFIPAVQESWRRFWWRSAKSWKHTPSGRERRRRQCGLLAITTGC